MTIERPPLGIMSIDLWVKARICELLSAIQRYVEVGYPVPQEWQEELNDHLYFIAKDKE